MTQIAGRFDLGERIGGGATADVHRAFDHELDRDVIVRLLRADAAADDDHVERFQREAEAATDIRHPNVVEVVEIVAHPVEVTGDRATIEAELRAGDTVCATARGTFVAVKPGHPAYHRW